MTAAPRPSQLDLYLGADRVGSLQDTEPLQFAYAPTWLARPQPMAVAAIALVAGRQQGAAVQAFFENLLPEGELRDYLAQSRKASTLFSLLLEVAGDTAGAFVIVAAGQAPAAPRYEETSWKALAAKLRGGAAGGLDAAAEGARISLAGAQDKISIALWNSDADADADAATPFLPRGTAPSTHIVKPDIRRLAKVWHSAANEAMVMRAALHCGLPTALVFYEPLTQACVVRRFDRLPVAGRGLERLVQYDMCQLAGLTSQRKYEKEGGPGLAQCAALVRRYSSQPAVDLRLLVRWVFFNLFTGNNDSHAKNLSLYYLPGAGVRLTPFYDLMCTRIYPGLSQEFAFSIGGQVLPARIGRSQIDAMAAQLGMQPAFVRRLAAELAGALPAAMARARLELQPAMSPGARTMAERLQTFTATLTKKLARRIAHASTPEKKLMKK